MRALSWILCAAGVALILGSLVVWMRRDPPAPVPAAPAEVVSSGPVVAPVPTVEWTTLLRARTCEAPCCGGEACAVDATNGRDYAQFCRPGSKTCAACASGLTCIPGGCAEELRRGESWSLRVDSVRTSASPPKSVCDQQDALGRVCVVKPAGVRACWTAAELCADKGPVLPISTDDLMGPGIDVEVQDAAGKVVGKTHRAFAEGMRRRGLCTGFVVRGFDAKSGVGEAQIVLLPR